MTFTKHVIERFQERITFEAPEVVRIFIQNDIENSVVLYRKNHIEKRLCKDIVYIVDCTYPAKPKVVTLYMKSN